MTGWWRLHGGPQHGMVVQGSGTRPFVMSGEPKVESFLDEIVGTLRWNAACEWYEAER